MTDPKVVISKEQILNVKDYDVREVDVPEWGGMIRLKSMSGKERDAFESKCLTRNKGGKIFNVDGLKALLITCVVMNPDNDELMFTSDDIENLNKKSAKVINQLFEVASEMNGLGKEAVDELVKN